MTSSAIHRERRVRTRTEAVPAAATLLLEGARDVTPMVLGLVPFAIAVGSAVSASSLSRAAGLLSGPAMLAGSAQLATVEMLDAGTSPLVVIVAALVINARLILYSASLAPWFAGRPLWGRLLLAVPVIDQMHFTCAPRFERGDLDLRGRTWYYIGAATWLVGTWTSVQALTIVIGANLPDTIGLEVAAPLVLVGLLAKSATDRSAVVAVVVGLVVAVVGIGLPMHTSVLVGTLLGIAAGVASTKAADERRA